jgi:hypothetical protein
MRFLGVVAALLIVYALYLALGMALVKPALEQFERGLQEYNDEIQRFEQGQ